MKTLREMINFKVILCASIFGAVFFAEQFRVTNAEEVEEIFVPDPNVDYYSLAYANIDIKQIVDNRRLFKKYKYCILAEKPKGCPKSVLAMRWLLPAIIETQCARCLPEHITLGKTVAEYACQKWRDDVEEIKREFDPDGSLYRRFAEKFGKIDCIESLENNATATVKTNRK